MGRKPCCSKEEIKRGAWTASEDQILIDYVKTRGEGKWRKIPAQTGLKRCGKSCRLRWLNYLRPDIKRGNITDDEEDLIIRLHKLLGNRWSLIAGRLPGRTDNEIKNYWNSCLSKKAGQGTKNQSNPELNKLVQKVGIGIPTSSGPINDFGPRQLPCSVEILDDENAEEDKLWSKDDEFSQLLAGFDSEEMKFPEFVGFDFSNLGDEFVDAFLGSKDEKLRMG